MKMGEAASSRSMRPARPRSFGDGFTIMEMLVVLIIIAILAAIAVPNFRRLQMETNLETSAHRLLLDIRKAKIAANRSGLRHFVSFPTGSTGWTIYRGDATGTAFATATGLVAISRDSLAPGVQFGPASGVSLPAIASISAPAFSSGFEGVTSPSTDDCIDGSAYPGSATTPGWSSSGGLVVACGGPTGDLSLGALCLTARHTDKAFAIGYNDASQIQPRLFRFDGSTWEEIQ